MRRSRFLPVWGFLLAFVTQLPAGFLASLTPAQARQLGLDHLTPDQAAAIDAAVEAYLQPQAATTSQQAAVVAVEEYKARQQPGVIARALAVLQQKQEQEKTERITAKISGRFTGWEGSTKFTLDNGQVWQQAEGGIYYTAPVTNAAVELVKAWSGRFRLYAPDGSWVTVKRIR